MVDGDNEIIATGTSVLVVYVLYSYHRYLYSTGTCTVELPYNGGTLVRAVPVRTGCLEVSGLSITFFQHESMRWRVCSPGDGEGVVGHDRAARGILWRTPCSCSCIGAVSLMRLARNSTPRSFTAVRYAAGCQRGKRLQPRDCPHHDPALRVECFCACSRATAQCVNAP